MPSISVLGGLFKHPHLDTDFLISQPFSLFLIHLLRTIPIIARISRNAIKIPIINPVSVLTVP